MPRSSFLLPRRAVLTERVTSDRSRARLLSDAETWAVYGRPPSLALYPYLLRLGIAHKRIDRGFWHGEIETAIEGGS